MGINSDVQGEGGYKVFGQARTEGGEREGVSEGPKFADVFCVCPLNHVDDDDDPTLILKSQ